MSYGVVIFTFPLQPEGVCYLFPLDEAVFAGFVGLVVLVTFSGEEDHVAGSGGAYRVPDGVPPSFNHAAGGSVLYSAQDVADDCARILCPAVVAGYYDHVGESGGDPSHLRPVSVSRGPLRTRRAR